MEKIALPWMNSFSWELVMTLESKWHHISGCLSHYSCCKSWDNHFDKHGLPASHANVLFPRSPLLQWPLLFHSIWTQDVDRSPCQEQINPLLWLCSAVTDLLYLCRFWVSPAGSHGLWLIQGRQQPLALCGQHVQQGVLPAHGGGLPVGNDRYFDTHDISIPLMLLWVKCD